MNKVVSFWVVRVSGGEFIEDCKKGKYIAIGWNKLGDLSWLLTEISEEEAKRKLSKLYARKWSRESRAAQRTGLSQVYRFVKEVRNGDFVLSPTATRTVLVGKIKGDYYPAHKQKDNCYYKQRRAVEWLKEIPRDEMSRGLQNSLSAHLTVFRLSGHEAELSALVEGRTTIVKPNRRYAEKAGEESVVGEAINFRGLVYGPINEQGVVFLFSKVSKDLNIEMEEIKTGFPDAIGRVKTSRGYARRRMEFEFRSSEFKKHGHSVQDCDIIVCWEHDWTDCPPELEVIELRSVVKELAGR